MRRKIAIYRGSVCQVENAKAPSRDPFLSWCNIAISLIEPVDHSLHPQFVVAAEGIQRGVESILVY